MDSFYGSFQAVSGGDIVGHQRLLLASFNPPSIGSSDYTYSDTYNVAANGTYSTPAMNYVVGNGIRIGSGIGPYLGLTWRSRRPP